MNNIIPNIDSEAYQPSVNEKSVVLLLVQSAQDQELFKQFLPNHLTIKSDPKYLESKEFDLCIVDEYSVYRNRDVLTEIKEKIAPIFLPVLLLSEDQETIQQNELLLEFADDVVYIPASSKLLKSRIQILLKQRDYSLKLEEKNKQLEQKNRELVEEKRKYRLLAQNATDMISVHKPDGTYLYVSPASKELIGYTPEELMGKNAFDNIHPEDSERLQGKVRNFEANQIERWEFRKKTKQGRYQWVESVMRPIPDEDDETEEIKEIQANTRDISGRKEFEKKLREEKEFIDKSIESLPELFYLIDEDQNFVKWNNIKQELGYSDEEVQDMQLREFYQEEDQEFIISTIVEALKEGSAEAEVDMVSKSGNVIPYYITAKSFRRGDKSYIVGFCMNLSAMKEAQYELDKQRELLDAVVNQTKSLIYIKDQSGEYRLVNDSYLNFYGLERDNVIGQTDREVHGEQIAEQTMAQDYKVFEGQKTIEVEEERSNGHEKRLYHTIKYPLRGIPGLEDCMCGISTDVTDRVKYEQQLEQSLSEKKTLLQEIHHRVKNNLAVVSGMLQLQALNTENKDMKKLLNHSESRIKTMALIHEKLYQSKSLSQIDFGLYVEELIKNIKQISVTRENIDIMLEFDSFNLNVNQAVPCALIINEIISNSYEHAFTKKKEGRICVQLQKVNKKIEVCISDNGKGLPVDYDQKESMGFTIINTLIKQLEADYEMESENGTKILFTFEKQHVKGSSSTLI